MGDVDYTDLDYRSLKTVDHSVTGQTVNWDDYIAYKREKSKSEAILHLVDPVAASRPNDSEGADQNTKVLSFAEISALIESGQTHLIPNNEVIPQGLNVRNFSNSDYSSKLRRRHRKRRPVSLLSQEDQSHGKLLLNLIPFDHSCNPIVVKRNALDYFP